MAESYSFTLNGQPTTVSAEPKDSTLDVLRDTLGVLTMKAGCSPQGLCGCCTALIDGKPRLTCTLPVKSIAGKALTTLEGADARLREAVVAAFAESGAAQCGYCTPGIALSTCALLADNLDPGDDALHRALAPHTCRCTGYGDILDGMRAAARRLREAAGGGAGSEAGAGKTGAARSEAALAVVLGERPYVDDLVRPGMLHGAVVFAPVARGVVEEVDTSAAAAMSGVSAVQMLRSVGDELLHAGDAVVIIAAEAPRIARLAAASVVVRATTAPPAAPAAVARARRRDGDIDAVLASCPRRVEGRFRFAAADALPLEPEAALAVPTPEGLVIYSAGHDGERIAEAVAAACGERPEVVLVPSGGSYGAKAVPSVEPWCARLAVATGRPVRLALDHAEATRLRPRRPGAVVEGLAAANEAGEWRALRLRVVFDGGAVAHDADRLSAQALAALVYRVDHLDVEVAVESTGSSPTASIRGAGAGPVVTAVESLVEQLAVATGADPLALRRRHLPRAALPLADAVAPAWMAHPGARGLAFCRTEDEGGARVVAEVRGPTDVAVQCNVPELGQGRDAALVETLAASSGLAQDALHIEFGRASALGRAASGSVIQAAASSGSALKAALGEAGSMAPLIGRRFVAQSPRGEPGFAAHLCLLADDGSVARLVARAHGATAADRRVLAGASAMGVGVALSEEVGHTDGMPETRFRYLGSLKSKQTPPIDAGIVPGGVGDPGEAGVAGACAAVAVAVGRFEGKLREVFPAKDSAAARGVGVRVRPEGRPAAGGAASAERPAPGTE